MSYFDWVLGLSLLANIWLARDLSRERKGALDQMKRQLLSLGGSACAN